MIIIFLTAIGVGLSTITGSLIAFFVKEIPHKISDAILSFAAGIMLSATFFSLLLPAISSEYGNAYICVAGIVAGAVFIRLMDKLVPHIHNFIGTSSVTMNDSSDSSLNKILLFLIAIAIHNFPEGMAVGVSFGNEDISNAFSIAFGISLQNIPEGMITILPLVLAGISKKKALVVALLTGSTEILGVLIGYSTVGFGSAVLPFMLSIAAGTMIYVISHDMIPETHSHGYQNTATFSLIGGFSVMLIISSLFS